MSVLSIKVPLRKKSRNLLNDPRMSVFAKYCVCMCELFRFFLRFLFSYTHTHTRARARASVRLSSLFRPIPVGQGHQPLSYIGHNLPSNKTDNL